MFESQRDHHFLPHPSIFVDNNTKLCEMRSCSLKFLARPSTTSLAATLTAARVAAHTSTLTAAVATAAIATATLTAALASTTLATPTSAQRGRRQGRHCRQASSTLAAAHLPSPSLLPLLPLPSPLSPGALAAAALRTLLPDAATSAAARGCGRRWRPREQLLVGVVRSHSPPVCEHSS